MRSGCAKPSTLGRVSAQPHPPTSVRPLRAWQAAALQAWVDADPRDFLAVATPGAGKTSFALSLAARLIAQRRIDRVVVVTPTEHLKTQWADAAARAGIALDPAFGSGRARTSRDFRGIVVTYAGVAANVLGLRVRTEAYKTLVVLDEVHHAGDAMSWGEAVREAFEPAARRLMLTGTPFRSDTNPIPFVRYEADGHGGMRSAADFSYGYGPALADGIVRPVLFLAYSGDVHWRTSAGDEVSRPARTALDARPGRAGAAHRSRPRRLLGAGGAEGREHQAE